ncbi:MAG TPA: putative CRISPR-associated protein [Candidatus Cloacimonetes bacterium]|nr:putative CRISPR-associated protein [Candidatus Cloacimonadota bacterium]
MVTLNEEMLMKRVILTTCGTSLFQTSCWDIEGSNGKKLNEKSFSDMDEDKRREYELESRSVLTGKIGEDISASFDLLSWDELAYLRDLPAELASLRAIQEYCKSHEEPLGEGDKAILLHSDNDEGRYCAAMIHNVLTNNNLLPEVEIDELEVGGLDPTDFEEFGHALSDIWHECIQRFQRDEDTRYIFNLTGGYKGVAILLGAFAYSKGLDTRIFYIYEETNYETISIMGFDNTKSNKKERFYADAFNIKDNLHKQPPGSPTPV